MYGSFDFIKEPPIGLYIVEARRIAEVSVNVLIAALGARGVEIMQRGAGSWAETQEVRWASRKVEFRRLFCQGLRQDLFEPLSYKGDHFQRTDVYDAFDPPSP